ncbi:MAG: hypothetical protein AB7O73_08910 [Bacteroidia bacterium]
MRKIKNIFAFALVIALGLTITQCKKKNEDTPPGNTTTTTGGNPSPCPTCEFPDTVYPNTMPSPKLVFKVKLDSTQVRLNNFGQPTVVASGNGAYSPKFNGIAVHYIELAQNDMTQLGSGVVLYHAPETTCGGTTAISFCESYVVKDDEVIFAVPITPSVVGTYKWLRVSLSYQNYDIKVKTTSAGIIDGTIASFVGYNTYVKKYKMKGTVMTPTANGGAGNHLQGYWGFHTKVLGVDYFSDGQAAQTTVVNPNPNSPIPPGSCVVTGEFVTNAAPTVGAPIVITGNETQDIVITISLSNNKSFEWNELTADGYFQPEIGETPVDMGIRGMIPKY